MEMFRVFEKCPEMIEGILSEFRQAVILTDAAGRMITTNQAFEAIFQISSQEAVGKELSVLFTDEDLTFMYPNLLNLAQSDYSFHGEVMLKRSDASRFFAELSIKKCNGLNDADPPYIIGVQDIDSKKQYERACRDGRFEDLLMAARGIAHELRNPLMGIGGFVNRLYKAEDRPAGDDRYFEFIFKNIHRIETLVRKVEGLVALPRPNVTKESMHELVDTAASAITIGLQEKEVRLTNRVEDGRLFVDRDQVIDLFAILLENALDVSHAGDLIEVEGGLEGLNFWAVVKDAGSGISEDDLPFIFNPFFSTKADGAGIDLALAKRIMEGHGGEIEANSRPHRGASFNLNFPLERRRPIRTSLLQV